MAITTGRDITSPGEERATTKRGPRPVQVKVRPDDPLTYMRFVATAAVDLLPYASRAEVANRAFTPRMEPSNLSAQLARPEGPTPDFLGRLERHYLSLKDQLHNGTPWLTSFQEGLQQAVDRGEPTFVSAPTGPIRVPGGWIYSLAQEGPRNSTEALVRGHALKAFLSDVRQPGMTANADIEDLLQGFDLKEKSEDTVAALLEVAAGPPHTGMPAVHLLANLWPLALNQVEAFIFGAHPAGSRGVRVLGRLLLSRKVDDEAMMSRVALLLRRFHEEEPPDAYQARSVLVEALRFAPLDDPVIWGWVTQALVDRTQRLGARTARPTRERVYAAHALFSRNAFDEAAQVMKSFAESGDEGLNYAAAFLGMLFKKKQGIEVPYPWPHERREASIVAGATKSLEYAETVPYSVRLALRDMVRAATLTINATDRRRICDAIQAAGLGASAVEGAGAVALDEASPPWLREHAAFIIGYLQTGHPTGAQTSITTLTLLAQDDHEASSVRHAALWGMGDVAGSITNIDDIKDRLGRSHAPAPVTVDRLANLVESCSASHENEVRRAAAYLAVMLARRCPLVRRKLPAEVSAALNRLADDDDPLVRGFWEWGKRIETGRIEGQGYLGCQMRRHS